MKSSIKELKNEVQRLVKGLVMVWTDFDNMTHVRIDDEYFTTEIILSTEDILFYNHDSGLLAQAVLKRYRKNLEKRFIKEQLF